MVLAVPAYYVYILASARRVLYVGVTSELTRRIWQHKHKVYDGFTKKYNIDQLVYYEHFWGIENAIHREKQLKHWPRQWKVNLIETQNPGWRDLALDWELEEATINGIPGTAPPKDG